MPISSSTWLTYLPVGGLVLARCAGVFALAPPLGVSFIPPWLRIGAAAAFAACLTPMLADAVPPPPGPQYPIQFCAELAIGAVIGFLGALLIWSALIAGQAVDSALSIAPDEEGRSPLATLYALLSAVIFVTGGGYRWLFTGFVHSFRALPPGQVLAFTPKWSALLSLPGAALITALSIATPVLLALIAVDLTVGLASRCAPSLGGAAVIVTSRWIIAIIAVAASLPLLAVHIGRLIAAVDAALRAVIGT